MVYSSKFSCFGHEWRLDILPGATEDSSDGMVAVFLERISKGKGAENQIFIFEIEDVKKGLIKDSFIQRIHHEYMDEDDSWGVWNFISRDDLLEENLD